MKSVVTLTLNPTIDKSTSVDRLVAEQKLTCADPVFEPGGGGINVSRALKRLGTDSLALFPAGGSSGTLLKQLLTEEGIKQLPIETQHWTRENFIVVEASTNHQYRFGMPGTVLAPDEQQQVIQALKSQQPDILVISGSLPRGVEPRFIREIARTVRQTGTQLIVDTSGEALRQALEEDVYLIKPNLGELSKLAGEPSLDNESAAAAAQTIIAQGRCQVVVISMGPQGACLVSKEVVEYIPAPTVKKQSTVGAGDSMVAGMVHMLSSGHTLQDAIRMGVACGTAATMNPGTELFKQTDAQRLYHWLKQTRYA